jgi:hypothetical protein
MSQDNYITKDDLKRNCDLLHKPIDSAVVSVSKKIDWLYVFVILTLGAMLGNLFVSLSLQQDKGSGVSCVVDKPLKGGL